jgi:elongator complex protein 3
MPKSYIKTEPGAARALLNDFDPYKQVFNRLTSLSLTGHKIDKIELIVLGGTRDVYPQEYKIEFIKGLYDACNVFDQLEIEQKSTDQNQRFAYTLKNLDKVKYSKTLQEAIETNETAKQRIIGLTLETRPEYVTDKNCNMRREM